MKTDLGGDGIKVIPKKSNSSSESSGDVLDLIENFEVTVALSDFRYLKSPGTRLKLLTRALSPSPSSDTYDNVEKHQF